MVKIEILQVNVINRWFLCAVPVLCAVPQTITKGQNLYTIKKQTQGLKIYAVEIHLTLACLSPGKINKHGQGKRAL